MSKIFIRLFSVCFTLYGAFSFAATAPSSGAEVTFYNVGQGNCTVIKSPSKQILIVDAGSSNTIGVPHLPDRAKYGALAKKIFNSIKKDLQESKWLWVVVSHPDKDHLNLVKEILTLAGPLCKTSLGVLLGGPDKNIYAKEDSKALVDFLESNGIRSVYGSAYELAKDGVSYIPGRSHPSILEGWDGTIEFLSLDTARKTRATRTSEIKKRRIGRSADDKSSDEETEMKSTASSEKPLQKMDDNTNKVSIVMKVSFRSFSLMLTGDKTNKETKSIINRLEKEGRLDVLKSDILLATHHGSLGDYVPEWVQHVDPSHVVFSAGRSYDHPRSDTVKGHIEQATRLRRHPWHFIQFQGDFINHHPHMPSSGRSTAGAGSSADPSSDMQIVKSIVREVPGSVEKARGYVHAITNKAIYVTANQGDITFFNNGDVKVSGPEDASSVEPFPIEFIGGFLSEPLMLDGTSIEIEEINLDEEPLLKSLLEKMASFSPFETLSMKSSELDDHYVDMLYTLIKDHKNLANLDLTGNRFSDEGIKKIQDAWGYRGLRLDGVQKGSSAGFLHTKSAISHPFPSSL